MPQLFLCFDIVLIQPCFHAAPGWRKAFCFKIFQRPHCNMASIKCSIFHKTGWKCVKFWIIFTPAFWSSFPLLLWVSMLQDQVSGRKPSYSLDLKKERAIFLIRVTKQRFLAMFPGSIQNTQRKWNISPFWDGASWLNNGCNQCFLNLL